jgi:hypothetical protein
VRKDVLDAAKRRRDRVRELAHEHDAARATLNSGSVAHGTANAPLNDTDCGVVLDRRKFWDYGPDGGNLPPRPMMESFRDWILPRLRREFPDVSCEITKRALLFEFHETLEFDGDLRTDPSVNLIVALERRDAARLWIPNTERPGWDPSHPQRHTELFRQQRARAAHPSRPGHPPGEGGRQERRRAQGDVLVQHRGARARAGHGDRADRARPGRLPARERHGDRGVTHR